jgi:hypothetical protein
MIKRMQTVEQKLEKIRVKWSLPFCEIETSHRWIVNDMHRIGSAVKPMVSSIGKAPSLKTMHAKTLWEALGEVDGAILSLENTQSLYLDGASDQFTRIKEQVNRQSTKLLELEKIVSLAQNRMHDLKPLLLRFKQSLDSSRQRQTVHNPGINTEALLQRIQLLEFKLKVQESWAEIDDGSSVPMDKLAKQEAMLRDQEAKINVLENRVVGEGVQMGNMCFQSFTDLCTWVMINIPTGRFGLFVDGHSLIEFFTSSVHLDTITFAAAESHSEKAGYITWQETVVAGSFKNLYPSLIGKGGSEDAICLPAITPGEKWSDGTSGIAPQLMRSMNDIGQELDSRIKMVLQNHPEAKQLAMECITQVKPSAIDLISCCVCRICIMAGEGFGQERCLEDVKGV